jgi:hypothetical protein
MSVTISIAANPKLCLKLNALALIGFGIAFGSSCDNVAG